MNRTLCVSIYRNDDSESPNLNGQEMMLGLLTACNVHTPQRHMWVRVKVFPEYHGPVWHNSETVQGRVSYCNSPKSQCVSVRALVVVPFIGTEIEEEYIRGAGRTLSLILGELSLFVRDRQLGCPSVDQKYGSRAQGRDDGESRVLEVSRE